MNEPTSAQSARQSFYVIVGSSEGALIGLQFVVITVTHIVVSHAKGGENERHGDH